MADKKVHKARGARGGSGRHALDSSKHDTHDEDEVGEGERERETQLLRKGRNVTLQQQRLKTVGASKTQIPTI